MRYISLFSGIEAATVAWAPLGWECVAVCEIEPFPCAVLAHHYPNVPNLGDITEVTEQQIKDLGQIDLVVFGSPCQNLSVAGNRKGLSGEQSGLFHESIRLIQYARKHGNCRFALWENVLGAFSSNKGADFTVVVGEMAGCSDITTPVDGWGKEGAAVGSNGMVEWGVLDAQWFGLAQRRKRVFAIVDFGNWSSRPPILLKRNSLLGDHAPSRETRKDVATYVASSAAIGCERSAEPSNSNSQRKGEFIVRDSDGINKSATNEELYIFVEPSRARALDVLTDADPIPTMQANMGTGGNNMPMLCRRESVTDIDCLNSDAPQSKRVYSTKGLSPALQAGANSGHIIPITLNDESTITTYPINTMTCQGRPSDNGRMGLGLGSDSDPCPTLTRNHSHAVAYGFDVANIGLSINKEVAATLCAHNKKVPQATFSSDNYIVRRLTPIECEKLQGFPPNYTQIPFRGKSAELCPVGGRYKALGNSMAVNVMAWIGRQIQEAVDYKPLRMLK